MCWFCVSGNCVPQFPADRWVRSASGLKPACRFHFDEGENVGFEEGCREFIVGRIISS